MEKAKRGPGRPRKISSEAASSRRGRTPKARGAAVTSTDAILAERGSRYGAFVDHARLTQALKFAMFAHRDRAAFDDDMVESLEMIAHKLGRIVNGDPTYADSWHDIAGYAKLVADRLDGTVR